MEMRTILTHLFRDFTFELTENEKAEAARLGTDVSRGKNAVRRRTPAVTQHMR